MIIIPDSLTQNLKNPSVYFEMEIKTLLLNLKGCHYEK